MLEAVMIWNEPNNKSHWDPEVDPGWEKFADMAALAGPAIRGAHPSLPRVLGGISPIDPAFIQNMAGRGVLGHVEVVQRSWPPDLTFRAWRRLRTWRSVEAGSAAARTP